METSKKIILVPDTSWLMEITYLNFNALTKILENNTNIEIRIHNSVIKELDGLKNNEKKSIQARKASSLIFEALKHFQNKIIVSDFNIKIPDKKFSSALNSEVDAIVLTLAQKSTKEGKTGLLTTDVNQKLLFNNDDDILLYFLDDNTFVLKNTKDILMIAFLFAIPTIGIFLLDIKDSIKLYFSLLMLILFVIFCLIFKKDGRKKFTIEEIIDFVKEKEQIEIERKKRILREANLSEYWLKDLKTWNNEPEMFKDLHPPLYDIYYGD